MDKKAYAERTEKYLKDVIEGHQTSISAAAASIVGTVVGYPVNINIYFYIKNWKQKLNFNSFFFLITFHYLNLFFLIIEKIK